MEVHGLGFWSRVSSALTPKVAGDGITSTGKITGATYDITGLSFEYPAVGDFNVYSKGTGTRISIRGGTTWNDGAFLEFWGETASIIPGVGDIAFGSGNLALVNAAFRIRELVFGGGLPVRLQVVRGGDVQIVGDNQRLSIGVTSTDLQLYSDGTYGVIDVANGLRLGNGTTNYANISSTGTLSFAGSAGLGVPLGTTPAPSAEGSLFLDTDAGANGTLKIYSNGAWRTIAAL